MSGKFFKRVLVLVSLAGIAWACGFAWFVHDALQPPVPPPHCDGIVALTGGQGRVDTSIRLLAQGRGDKLLISGVDPITHLGALAPGIAPALAARITLGYRATTTVGNASETADWVRNNDIHTLIVVTAGYHIRRATLEIARAIPSVQLWPYPVQPPALQRKFGKATLRLLVLEYDKWLIKWVYPEPDLPFRAP